MQSDRGNNGIELCVYFYRLHVMKFDSSSLKGQCMSQHDNSDMHYISGGRVHLFAASFMLTLS